jgi:hypothetical protein
MTVAIEMHFYEWPTISSTWELTIASVSPGTQELTRIRKHKRVLGTYLVRLPTSGLPGSLQLNRAESTGQ